MNNTIPTVSGLLGLWQRSLIAWPDGRRDTTTRVRWLQGLRAYIDLRQPPDPPDFSGVSGLGQLSVAQCAWLARQEGFAGQLSYDANCFEWQRSIDFQPDSQHPDVGTLHWDDQVLVETGRDTPYVEHWHRDEGSPTQPTCAVGLLAADSNSKGLFLRVGTYFMFARERATALPVQRQLGQCVAEARNLRDAQDLIDCEISFGEVHAAVCRITVSTLPYRVGDILDQRLDGSSVITSDRARDGNLMDRHWHITAREGSLTALELE